MLVSNIKSLHRARSVITHQLRLLPCKKVIFVVICIYFTLLLLLKSRTELNSLDEEIVDPDFDNNSYGLNLNLMVSKTRYRDVPRSKWKNILFWNDAYGVRTYDVGFGNEHFYNSMCPDTRSVNNSNNS